MTELEKMIIRIAICLMLVTSQCLAGGICSKAIVRKKVLVVDNAVLHKSYHSVGQSLYNEAVIEQAVERAVTRILAKMQSQQSLPPSEPTALAARYPMLTAKCISCHGDQPKDNNLSLTQSVDAEGNLSCELRMKCLQQIDSGKMPKGQTLVQSEVETLFNELVYGGKKP